MTATTMKSQRSDVLVLPASDDAITREDLRQWATDQVTAGRRLAIDLFAGAGGLSLGIEAAGWTVAAAVDVNERALETHRHNLGGLALNVDLSDLTAREKFIEMWHGIRVDLVAGGPPCQPFSRAGRSKIRSLIDAGVRDECDHRKDLWRAFLDTALRLAPRAILMENVPDMGLGDDFRVVRFMVDELEAAGYETQLHLADAWRVGVPQHRQRLLLLARNDHHAFAPFPQIDTVDLDTSIGDLPRLNGSQGGRQLAYDSPEHPGWFMQRMREGAPERVIHDHMTRAVRDDDLEVFGMMTPQTLYSAIPEHLRRYRADSFDDKYKRLDAKGLSRSITAHIAKDGYWYIHPTEDRTLTVREAARIQTFPDRFRFAGTRSDAFRQIGNAVPPLLGQAAASALSPTTPEVKEHVPWKEVRTQLADWANEEAKMRWYAFPGPAITPPVALVVALLSGRRLALNVVGAAAAPLRNLRSVSETPYQEACAELPRRLSQALTPMLPLVGEQDAWDSLDEIEQTAALGPAQRRLFRLLLGEDIMLQSQDVFRVTARVFNSRSDETNRLTKGRLELARLIGGGESAPVRMAAVRLLGNTACTPGRVLCGTCPLTGVCLTARVPPSETTSCPEG